MTRIARGRWIKASYSNNTGTCVEVYRRDDDAALVRDTKNRAGDTLAFTSEAWMTFLDRRPGRF